MPELLEQEPRLELELSARGLGQACSQQALELRRRVWQVPPGQAWIQRALPRGLWELQQGPGRRGMLP